MRRLENKVAVITGAGSGLGKETALLFAKEGAKVVAAELNSETGQKTADEIQAFGGEAVFIQTDVAKSTDCKKMVNTALEQYGKLDILFNNAGITGPLGPDIAHLDEKEFDKVFGVNMKGVWLGIHYAAPVMVKNGGGSIISTASTAGVIGCMGGTLYGTSKGAVIQLTRTVANELGLYNVRCNCVSPYVMNTALLKFMEETEGGRRQLELFKIGNPMGKLVEPIEVANAVLFLASDESSGITGQNIHVDKGNTVQGQPYDEPTHLDLNKY